MCSGTRLACVPLLLMLSGLAVADRLPSLSVSPDLILPPAHVLEPAPRLHDALVTSANLLPVGTTEPAARRKSPEASAAEDLGVTEVRALRIVGVRAVELVAEGEAELVRGDRVLTADRVVYNELTDEATADGNVRLTQGNDWLAGDWARLVVHEWVGELDRPTYLFSRDSRAAPGATGRTIVGTGAAEVLYFEGVNQYRMVDATWTTCEPSDPDWFIRAADLELDYDRDRGVARGATLVFKDMPILWWPKMSFPLAEQRKSGFLTPTLGASNRTGFDVAVPYYWNIAPNYDATLTPRVMARRGLQLGGEYRYLTADYRGEIRGEWLPEDRVIGRSRSLGALQHHHWLSPRLSAAVDYNWVSDDAYFEDLSARIAVASRVNLLREGRLGYQGNGWSAGALVQGYQTLDGDGLYRRLPQLTLSARRADLPAGLSLALQGEYVDFKHSTLPQGRRLHLQPQLSLPLQGLAYFVMPRLAVYHTRYALDRAAPSGRGTITRSVPVMSIDGGLFFERDTVIFGQAYEQTLEPRLFYLRVPYREQADIPVFDSGRLDFGFAQLFAENRYAGIDRIGDANEFTAAVTTRFIEPTSGAERLRATLGQRFYLSDQRVTLPEEKLRDRRRTDILGALSGRVTGAVSLDSLWQYDPFQRQTQRFNFAARYRPEFGKALNLSYRYAPDLSESFEDFDLSAQWPLARRWFGIGRMTRSLREKRVTEAVAGVEYLSTCGCWVFRTAAHRFATREDRATNALFFQLELTGLGGIGPSPVNLLTRSVPGYGKINDSMSDRYFGLN